MPNLMELAGLALRWLNLVDFVASENDGEIPAELLAELESAEHSLSDKLEACAALRENWLASAAARKDAANRYAALAKQDEKNAARLADWIALCMTTNGMDKATAGRYKLAIVGNGGAAPLLLDEVYKANPAQLPAEYQKVTIAPDNAAIKAALDAGVQLPFATIGERGKSLRIK